MVNLSTAGIWYNTKNTYSHVTGEIKKTKTSALVCTTGDMTTGV